MSCIKQAFECACKDAIQATGHYVSLMESVPYYGGPEEGGWWGEDHRIVAYQIFPTAIQAEAAKAATDKLATELSAEALREYGDGCLRDMDWLDARGLDADFLPEVDGESRFYVTVTEGLPEETFGPRHYE
jgi:hypothetical protein